MPQSPLKAHSLILAPLEGITDALYRRLILEHYPDWDFLFTDFYRIPRHANKSHKFLAEHLGQEIMANPLWFDKTVFQVLGTSKDALEETCEHINELQIKWLDLNAGCPMKRVIGHKGGSYLLSDLDELRLIVKRLRKAFPHFLTVKMRIGFKDDKNFFDILKMLEDEGINAITLHGRLQVQLYLGRADWSYIEKAVQTTSLPLIANGDIWTVEDAKLIYKQTNCHSLMLGRGAIKAPWLASLIKNKKESFSLLELKNEIKKYLYLMYEENLKIGLLEENALRRVKSLSINIFEAFPNGNEVRTKALRSQSLSAFKEAVEELVLENVDE